MLLHRQKLIYRDVKPPHLPGAAIAIMDSDERSTATKEFMDWLGTSNAWNKVEKLDGVYVCCHNEVDMRLKRLNEALVRMHLCKVLT
jgi:hypothetical protein